MFLFVAIFIWLLFLWLLAAATNKRVKLHYGWLRVPKSLHIFDMVILIIIFGHFGRLSDILLFQVWSWNMISCEVKCFISWSFSDPLIKCMQLYRIVIKRAFFDSVKQNDFKEFTLVTAWLLPQSFAITWQSNSFLCFVLAYTQSI